MSVVRSRTEQAIDDASWKVFDYLATRDFEDAVQATADIADIFRESLKHTNAKKLTPIEVRGIRLLYKRGTSQVDLARRFNLNPATVSRIVRGEYY